MCGTMMSRLAFASCLATTWPVFGVGAMVVDCRVIGHIPGRPLVMLEAGRNQGVNLGDLAVLPSGGSVLRSGEIFYIEAQRCAVRLGGTGDANSQSETAGPVSSAPSSGPVESAVVVSRLLPSVCRVALPPSATVWADLEDLAPGHRTVWLSRGRDVGFRTGDPLLIWRGPLVVGRGYVMEAMEANALIRFQPVTSNVSIRRGDRAGLSPAPAEKREGILSLPVLMVEPEGSAQAIWLSGGTADGVFPDHAIEVFRGETYVATATVDLAGESVARAVTVEACTREPVKAGDRAVLVHSDSDSTRIAGRVFRIEKDYCLISVGEDTGVRRDQQLHVVRQREVVGSVKVKTIKQGYCGAEIQSGSGGQKLTLWDQVLSYRPTQRAVQELGQISTLSGDGLFASVRRPAESRGIETGTLVTLVRQGEPLGAASIVHCSPSLIVLHMPGCWRIQEIPVGVSVMYSHDLQGGEE